MAVEGARFQDDLFKIAAYRVVDPTAAVAAEMPVQGVATVGDLGEYLGLTFCKPERAGGDGRSACAP
jgi:hypothetical protein